MKFAVKFDFDNTLFFKWPTAYKSHKYKGFEVNILWLWFSVRMEGSWKNEH